MEARALSEDVWAQACNDLEDALGLTTARQERDQARCALVVWGLTQVRALWPQYGFARHKGYGTAEHLAALRAHGACILHRRSFAPVAQALSVSLQAGCAPPEGSAR